MIFPNKMQALVRFLDGRECEGWVISTFDFSWISTKKAQNQSLTSFHGGDDPVIELLDKIQIETSQWKITESKESMTYIPKV